MPNPQVQSFQINTRNTFIPFFPSFNYPLTEEDKGNIDDFPAFMWLQAIWNSAEFSGLPQLVVYNGTDETGLNTPIYSLITFPFSGAIIPIKGKGIIQSATDIFGNVIESTPIGPTGNTDITLVYAWGGMY